MNTTYFRGSTVNLRTLTIFFWVFLIATAALAGDEKKAEIVIAVDGDDGGKQVMRFVGDDASTVLDDLEVGEKQTLTDADGRQVNVQRTANGMLFEVEDADRPLMGGAVALVCEEGRTHTTVVRVQPV